MPSLDELLAGLEDAPESADDGEDETPPANESPTIKQIRDAQKSWEKKARELGKELKATNEKLQAYETEKRETTVKSVFAELDLPEKQANLFLKTHEGEITPDAIRQFVTDYGLKDLSEETGGTTEDKSQGFQPGGTGGAAAPTGSKIPRAEWLQLVQSDPLRAQKLHSEGRVDMSDVAIQAH